MKTLVLLCLSLAVALGIPVLHPDEEQISVPLLGDRLPVQGHVVAENPAPQAFLSLEEHKEKVSPVKMIQRESTAEFEVEVKPDVKEDLAEAEVKQKPEVKVEQEVKVDKEVEPQQEMLVEAETKMEQQPETDPELEAEPDFKVDAEVEEEASMEKDEEAKPEVKVEEEFGTEEKVEPQPEVPVAVEAKELEPEPQAEPDFKVESEIKVEPDVQIELEPEDEPLLTEAQEEPEVQMSLDSEINPYQVIEDRRIDMEGKYEAMGESHMEELLDDDNLIEDEARQEATFQGQNPVAEALAEDEEELLSERNDVLKEETVMEMEPEMIEEPLQNQDVVPDAPDLEVETELDTARQQMPFSENYFPEEEAGMEMRYEKQEDSVDEEEYVMMLEEARREAIRVERSPARFFEAQRVQGGPQTDVMSQSEQSALMRGADNQGWRQCPGVILEEKCYLFFKGPKKAADAEFFCQESFPKGHLASITSQHVHRELMDLILKENGHYTRTWVGGIRFLDTNSFVWLDGSHWSYDDWLSGEPNNTSGLENCLEVLSLGNGKFNDFTCWEPQSFICSYAY